MSDLDKLNNTLTARQKQLLAAILNVQVPISLQDSYMLLKDIQHQYKCKLYGKAN